MVSAVEYIADALQGHIGYISHKIDSHVAGESNILASLDADEVFL